MANVSLASRLVPFFFFFFFPRFSLPLFLDSDSVFSNHSIRGVPRWWKKRGGREKEKNNFDFIPFAFPFFPLPRVIVRYAISFSSRIVLIKNRA